MHRIFISHASRDNREAAAMRDWLHEHGYKNQVFLDIDPNNGLRGGQKWRDALLKAAGQCEAVLCLVSEAWLVSRECQRELDQAEALGKAIIPLIIEPVTQLPADITKWQYRIFHSHDETLNVTDGEYYSAESQVTFPPAALAWLLDQIRKVGLEASEFAFDVGRPIFPGFRPFDVEDAAIFFGRSERIRETLNLIRSHAGRENRGLVILGGSGAGKSSFLRAGVLARLRRDAGFVALRPLRAAYGALRGSEGLHAALALAAGDVKLPLEANAIVESLASPQLLSGLLDDLISEHCSRNEMPQKEARLVIAIDQGEEWFNQEGLLLEEAKGCLSLISALTEIRDDVLVIAAVRSDASEQLGSSPPMQSLKLDSIILRPIEQGALADVIRGPIRVAQEHGLDISFSDDLVEELVRSSQGVDVVPMLAFTLERLIRDAPRGGEITKRDYAKLQIEAGVINGAVEKALKRSQIPLAPEISNPRLRELFVPALCTLEPTTRARLRRQCLEHEIAPQNLSLAAALVDERVLTKNVVVGIDGRSTPSFEIAHEAVLRQWNSLNNWLEEESESLLDLSRLKRAAEEWRLEASPDEQDDFLIHSGKALENAERLAAVEGSASRYERLITKIERSYLAECRRKAELQHRDRDARVLELRRQLYLARQPGIRQSIEAADPKAMFRSIAQLIIDFDGPDVSDYPYLETLMNIATIELAVERLPLPEAYAASRLEALEQGIRGAAVLCRAQATNCAAVGTDANAIVVDHPDLVAPAVIEMVPDAVKAHIAAALAQESYGALWHEAHAVQVDTVRKRAFFVNGEGALERADFSGDNRLRSSMGARMIALHPTGENLVVITHTGASLVDPNTLEAKCELPVSALAFGQRVIWSPTGRHVAFEERGQTESRDASRNRFVVHESERLFHEGFLRPILDDVAGDFLIFSPCGRFLMSQADNEYRVWSILRRALVFQKSAVASAAFSTDGSQCILLGFDNSLRIWDLIHPERTPEEVQLGLRTYASDSSTPRNQDRSFGRGTRTNQASPEILSWSEAFITIRRGKVLERWPIWLRKLSGPVAVRHWIGALNALPSFDDVVTPEVRAALFRLLETRDTPENLAATRRSWIETGEQSRPTDTLTVRSVPLETWSSRTGLAIFSYRVFGPLGTLRAILRGDLAQLSRWAKSLWSGIASLPRRFRRGGGPIEFADNSDAEPRNQGQFSEAHDLQWTERVGVPLSPPSSAAAPFRLVVTLLSWVVLAIWWPIVQTVRALAATSGGIVRLTMVAVIVGVPTVLALLSFRVIATSDFAPASTAVSRAGAGLQEFLFGPESEQEQMARLVSASKKCGADPVAGFVIPAYGVTGTALRNSSLGEEGPPLPEFRSAIGASVEDEVVAELLGPPCDEELSLWRIAEPHINEGRPLVVSNARRLAFPGAESVLVFAALDAECGYCNSGYLFAELQEVGVRVSFVENSDKATRLGKLFAHQTQPRSMVHVWQPIVQTRGSRRQTVANVFGLGSGGMSILGEVPISDFDSRCSTECAGLYAGYYLSKVDHLEDKLLITWTWERSAYEVETSFRKQKYVSITATYELRPTGYVMVSGRLPTEGDPDL